MKSRFHKWLTAGILSITTIFSCGGCINMGGGGTPPMSMDDINKATAPNLYYFSAPVYDNADFDTSNTDGFAINNSTFFEDAYLLVDPGHDGKFVNDYKSTPVTTTFARLVEAQIDTLATNIYTKLNYVYGNEANSPLNITPQLLENPDTTYYGDNVITLIPSTTLTESYTDTDNDIVQLNGLSAMAQLTRTSAPINTKSLYFADAMRGGYLYEYTIEEDEESGATVLVEGYGTTKTSYEWNYADAIEDSAEIIALNIAEILAGYELSALSTSYSSEQFASVIEKIDHLGIMTADRNTIVDYLLNVVIGKSNVDYDNEILDAFTNYSVLVPSANIDTNNGSVSVTVDNETNLATSIQLTGNLGFNLNTYLTEEDAGISDYKNLFVKLHNYRAYQTIINTVVDNAVNATFTSGTLAEENVYHDLPRLMVYVTPINILDGTQTTTTNDDYENIEVTYNPDIKKLNIKSIILRPKTGIIRNETICDEHQYAEGFNLTGIEAVFFTELGYNVDIMVEVQGKANGVDIIKSDGTLYGYSEAIIGGQYPSGEYDQESGSSSGYPETTTTPLLDEDKSKEEWVGNQMLAYNGTQMTSEGWETVLATATPVFREGTTTLIYTTYSLSARLNASAELFNLQDITATGANGETIYVRGYRPDMKCGDNYLQMNLIQTNVVNQSTNNPDPSVTNLPITVLSINPDIAIWVWGATDQVDVYAQCVK